MKNKSFKILFLIWVMFLLPVFVVAKEKESEITAKNEMIELFEFDKISIHDVGCTRFFNYHATGKEAIAVTGYVENGYNKAMDVNMDLYLYDAEHNVLDIYHSILNVNANGTQSYSELIYQNEINFALDDVAYFSFKANVSEDLEMLDKSESDKYVFENYNVKIKVNKNNTYNVEESFDARFKNFVDVIRIGIPYRLRYTEDNGTKISKRVLMSDIQSKDNIELKTEDGIRNIYIGELDKNNTTKSYSISYDYNAFEDTIDNQDEFLFYLIDNEDAKIDGFSFTIEFPEDIDTDNVSFVDEHGTKLENVDYEVNGNTITGKFKTMINSNISYAVKVVLKDGYFEDTDRNVNSVTKWTVIASIAAIVITIVIWFIQRKRNSLFECNNIYFNDKLNSLEMGYLYNGEVKDSDIATLFITLANKGFIEIEKDKKNYKIVKVKDYDQDDRLEKVFMNELFKKEDVITRKELVSNVDYMKYNIEYKISEHKKKNRLFIKPVFNYKLVFWFMALIIFTLATINIFNEYQPSVIVVNVIVGFIGYLVLLYGILYEQTKIEKLLCTFVGLMFIVSPIAITKYLAFIQDEFKLAVYVIAIISMLVIIVIAKMMNTRSYYGMRMLNKINAYKKYLIEYDNEVKEIKNNKYCFYQVLPYAFVLGISDKWYEKFENLEMIKPKWYDSDKFSLEEFYNDVKDIYADIFISLKSSKK